MIHSNRLGRTVIGNIIVEFWETEHPDFPNYKYKVFVEENGTLQSIIWKKSEDSARARYRGLVRAIQKRSL